MWRQLGKRHPVDKALSNIRGPVTAKLCEVTAASQNALFVKSQRSGSRKCTPPPIPLAQGEPAKCQKSLPS